MKKKYSDFGNGVSYNIEFSLDKRELDAVKRFWPEFTFHLNRGEGWGVIPNDGFFGVAWVDGNPAPGGKFNDGVWKGIIYPNGREDIPNIDESIKTLYDTAMKSLAPVMETYEALEKHINP